jgi:hypothetical protein
MNSSILKWACLLYSCNELIITSSYLACLSLGHALYSSLLFTLASALGSAFSTACSQSLMTRFFISM